ncbi:PAX-interacting protein 1 [Drosophila innubila]|uniref:PAX-interacting protein 1 n=1 Tax=Drosophila innubila TaxID=198719 RepID=UPI00148C7902|nr:PAX-interacting protein 1 [Drosophila innubila]
MGVIYKILKQQRHQQQQQCINMDLSMATKCKVQAAIKQRQLQRLELLQQVEQQEQEQQEQQEQQDSNEDTLAEQQLQQLCRFLAENAARKKRQRLRLQQQQQYNHTVGDNAEQPLCELQPPHSPHSPHAPQSPQAASTHDMDLLMEHLSTCSNSDVIAQATTTMTSLSSAAPRDSILLKIRHQIFERKRQRQRQLAELVKQRLVVWRPW